MNMKNLLLLCLLVFGFFSISAQERYVRPVDEAKKDASFLAFRAKLISVVKKQDVKYILSIVDKNIQNGFGGDNGIDEFIQWWKIRSPGSKFWSEFLPVITNGGRLSKEEKDTIFSAPYNSTEFPGDLDAFEHQIIFGNNVNLRTKPDLKSEAVARLSYNIVKVDYQNSVADVKKEGEYLWLKVETLGGKKGFVNAKFVRSPIDYRAVFVKKGRSWKLTAFVSGD
jgi:hypothetical protein